MALQDLNAVVLDSVSWGGGHNPGGTEEKVYYVEVSDIETMPSIAAAPTTPGEVVTIATDIVLKAGGKKFHELYITRDKGQLMSEGVGEIDGKSFVNKFSGFHPGSDPAMLGTAAMLNNGSFVFLVPEANGQYRIVGNLTKPAKCSASEVNTGAATADLAGWSFTVEAPALGPAPVYTGAIQLTPTA